MVKRISNKSASPTNATMRDVAEVVGVSQATVSYVLNGKTDARIRPETRQRVLEAASLLNYHPNAIARAMASGRSLTIGVYQSHTEETALAGTWTAAIMRGIGEVLHARQIHLLLYGYRASENPAVKAFLDGRVEGLIFLAPHVDDRLLPELAQAGFPTAIVGSHAAKGSCLVSVDADNVNGARLATEYLLQLGHRHIAHLQGPDNVPNALDRISGYTQALETHGLPVRPENLIQASFSREDGYQAALKALHSFPRPTALFAANDLSAIGAIMACMDSGLRVPEDVAVVGYDDAPVSEMVRPTLTTVRQPTENMGRAAATMLLDMIDGKTPEQPCQIFSGELIVRESTGAPLSGGF